MWDYMFQNQTELTINTSKGQIASAGEPFRFRVYSDIDDTFHHDNCSSMALVLA